MLGILDTYIKIYILHTFSLFCVGHYVAARENRWAALQKEHGDEK